MPVLGPDTRYAERLNRAINFAHLNSHHNLQLDHLADVACLSKFHFSRLFHEKVGESPGRFLRRIRLERCASLLKYAPEVPIKQVAYSCGFGSNQLFSRTFGDQFGFCPSKFRNGCMNRDGELHSQQQLVFEKLPTEGLDLTNDIEDAADSVDITYLAPTLVAYSRSFGGYGRCENIDRAFDTIVDWGLRQNEEEVGSTILGVSWDFPQITPDDRCRFDACIPIDPKRVDVSEVSRQVIPGGTYASAKFICKKSEDATTIWRWFTLTLCNAEKFKHLKADVHVGPWFEKYYTVDCGKGFGVELFMPVNLINN